MTVPARLSIVTLGVRDLPALLSLFERLCWTIRSEDDEFFRFEVGVVVLKMFPLHLLAGEANLPVPERDGAFRGVTLAINVEQREMVDEAMAVVGEAGGRVLAEPVDREWGGRSGYFSDPEGNVWEIAWAPGTSFDARGALIWPE
jgi:catechol 2,3-dioxygenase-like lactoylglutathione lyase family enzyme